MRAYLFATALASVAATTTTSCKSLQCAPGTIEQADRCVPADETVSSASCGAFTVLQGDVCVPQFPPTTCDPATTTASTDPTTGVTTCIGTGVPAGCMAPFACPTPAAGTQTACGQLYDLATGAPFTATAPTGALCTIGATADGPCSVAIQAFDALGFASDPGTTPPLAVGELDIDDCGRFRITDITQPTGPLIALGLDDAAPASRGPAGTTQPVGVAFPAAPNTTTTNVEDFIVTSSTTDAWLASGGPSVGVGVYVAIFRAHLTGTANQAGVTVLQNGAPIPTDDFYFTAADSTRVTIDPAASATGPSGAALLINAVITDGYSGSGGLATDCAWTPHPGAQVPGVVFVQTFRPQDSGGTCAQ